MASNDTQFKSDNYYSLKDVLEKEIVNLKTQFDKDINALREIINSKFDAIQEATNKALSANDKRLEGMNEFRDALKDQTARFVIQKDFETQHERVREDIKKLEISKATLDGKASSEDVKKVTDKSEKAYSVSIICAIMAGISIIISIISHFIK